MHAQIALAHLVGFGRRQAVAHVDERRLAPETQDPNVVAEIVGPAGAEVGRRLRRDGDRAAEGARLPLRDAGAKARLVVGPSPGAIGIDGAHDVVDDEPLWPL